MQGLGLQILFKRLGAIRYMMADKSVSFGKKLLVILAALYILTPVDLVPIAIFPVAWMDDLFVFGVVLWYLKGTLDTYWLGEPEVDLSQNFDSDDIVEGVEYEVQEEEDTGKVIHLRREDPNKPGDPENPDEGE